MKNWSDEIIYNLENEIYIINENGEICFINRKDTTIFGIKVTILYGKSIFELLNSYANSFDCKSVFDNFTNGNKIDKNSLKDISFNNSNIKYNLTYRNHSIENGIAYYEISFAPKNEYLEKDISLILENELFSGGSTVLFKWNIQPSRIIEYVSPNVYSQFGYEPKKLMNNHFSFLSIIHPDDLIRVKDEINLFNLKGYKTYEQEYRILHANGTYRYISDFTVINTNEKGIPISFQGTILDITDKKKAIFDLRENLKRFNLVIEGITDAVIILDDKKTIIYCNEATNKIFGWNNDELIGKLYSIFIPNRFIPMQEFGIDELWDKADTEFKGIKREVIGIRKDGTEIMLGINISAWKLDGKLFFGCMMNDISEWKKHEERISYLASYPEINKFPIVEFNWSGELLYANPCAIYIFPTIEEEVLNHAFIKGIDKNTLNREIEIENEWYLQNIHFFKEKSIVRIYAVNITETVKAKELAEINRERLNFLLETLPDAIFLKDGENRWQIINSVAKKLFRLENIDWLGKTDIELAEINLPLQQAHLFCIKSDEDAWQNGKLTIGEEQTIDEYGNELIFEVLKVPKYNKDNSKNGLVTVGRDITKRRTIEKEEHLNYLIQEQLNKILKVSLKNAPQKENLQEILDIVINSSFIELKKVGGIFLVEEGEKKLKLECHCNFSDALLNMCSFVDFGVCICGRAAQEKQTQFVSCINHLHDNIYENMMPHGHYSIPLLSEKNVIGVIVVYLSDGHKSNPKEIIFLESVANIIVGMVQRNKAENKIIENLHFLNNLDKINNILQKTSISESLVRINELMLQSMLEMFTTDRIWLISPSELDSDLWTIAMECTNDAYPGAYKLGNEQFDTQESKKILKEMLSTNEPVIYHEKDLPQISLKHQIKSQICIAIYPKIGKPWLLGMHQCEYDRKWTIEEIRFLKQIAERYSFGLSTYLLLNELRNSEQQYRSLTETAHDIIISYDFDGNIKYMNNIGIDYFGFEDKDYFGGNIYELIDTSDIETIKEILSQRKDGYSKSKYTEVKLRNKDGNYLSFEFSSSILKKGEKSKEVISIIRNITDRKIAEDKLIKQNIELQTINSELDRFVYSTSHDLRAPLTSVLGLIYIMKELIPENEELYSYVLMMEESIERLDGVIKNILDYSRSNRVHIKNEPIDIQEIYNNVISGISYMKGINLVKKISNIDCNLLFVSDKIRIITIISNLITNAIKYKRTDDIEAFVHFTFKLEDNYGVIIVEDNGEGIAKDKHNEIFEMFVRNSTNSDGSGLGLYIVKQNVNKLNGSIELESELGVGTKFIIKIPNKA